MTIEQLTAFMADVHPAIESHRFAVGGDGRISLWPAELDGRRPSDADVADYPKSLTDVEKAIIEATDNFRQARLAAPVALDRLKGTVLAALLGAGMDRDEATAAGVGLVLLHGPLLAAFEAAGGHPVAGAALYAAISSPESVAALPWLSEPVLAIFAAALTPGK